MSYKPPKGGFFIVYFYHSSSTREEGITAPQSPTKRATRNKLPADFIPSDAFPSSHYGRKKLSLTILRQAHQSVGFLMEYEQMIFSTFVKNLEYRDSVYKVTKDNESTRRCTPDKTGFVF
ncbi:hypothetical protein ACPUEX_09310 [Enterobacter vonholyi]